MKLLDKRISNNDILCIRFIHIIENYI